MKKVIKLRKGLDIQLAGKAEKRKLSIRKSAEFALVPDDFTGITPKLAVREDDRVKAGEALFVDKNCPEARSS